MKKQICMLSAMCISLMGIVAPAFASNTVAAPLEKNTGVSGMSQDDQQAYSFVTLTLCRQRMWVGLGHSVKKTVTV